MADGNNTDDLNNQNDQTPSGPDIEKLVKERVDATLKDIKEKLDKAYAARDEANRKLAASEDEKRNLEIKQMEAEGRKLEALQLQLDEANAALKVANDRITELTLDVDIREALSGVQFRTDKAAQVAFKEIAGNLKKDDKGVWRHASTGASIKDYIGEFVKDEEQSFLLKPKTSSGAGTGSTTSTSTETKPKSLFELSQEEVIEKARKGELSRK